MRSQLLIISLIIIFYIAASYYSGRCILRLFSRFIEGYVPVFWVFWSLMTILPFANRILNNYFSVSRTEGLMLLGYYWLAFIYYLALTFLAIDVLFFAAGKISLFGEIPEDSYRLIVGIGAVFFTALLLVYGTYNARNPVICGYDLTIPKKAGDISSLRGVLIADLHLGFVIDQKRLGQMIEMVNSLNSNPDIIFLAGDIIEEDALFFTKHKMAEQLQKLNPRLGIYAVLGNHEYLGGQVDEIVKCLREAGIFVLRDEYVKIDDSFYVVGRDDISSTLFNGWKRADLQNVMKGIDRSLPVILLDHQPFSMSEAEGEKIDLQLSGHTHRGQFFPNNLITSLIFTNAGGYLEKNGMQSIVSAGFGTWGPPIRIGNFPEIVEINIRFAD